MDRERMIREIAEPSRVWDLIVVGGGATGLGTGLDAAARGYDTLLLEQKDFSVGTSSRSTKLVHGGVRYLQQGNISLVMDALHERGRLLQNAPHIVRNQSFVVPNYGWWEGPFYGIGLKLYDVLAGKLGFGPSRILSREETMKRIPTVEPKGLKGGVIYHDGQFDDARLAVTLARTMAKQGGTVLNHMAVTGLSKTDGLVTGVVAADGEERREYRLQARAVINATGIFVDAVRRMDDPAADRIIAPSQGVHLILDKSFLPGKCAVMVPHTDDGRVLFAVPWNDRVIIGTTDTPIETPSLEPLPLDSEIEYLLSHASRYLTKAPGPSDVLSVFVGIRPLISARASQKTSALSRDHHVLISPSGLITVAGGKWTTYRKMGEDAVDKAAAIAGLPAKPCVTENLKLSGWIEPPTTEDHLSIHGSDRDEILSMESSEAGAGDRLHDNLPYRRSEVIWAARREMARTVEDVLSRRTRALILDARAAMEVAPAVAGILAKELGRDKAWEDEQVRRFLELGQNHILKQKPGSKGRQEDNTAT